METDRLKPQQLFVIHDDCKDKNVPLDKLCYYHTRKCKIHVREVIACNFNWSFPVEAPAMTTPSTYGKVMHTLHSWRSEPQKRVEGGEKMRLRGLYIFFVFVFLVCESMPACTVKVHWYAYRYAILGCCPSV